MHQTLLLLVLPVVFAATRSLAAGIESSSKSGARQAVSAETEFELLFVIIFCLSGLLVFLSVMARFPGLGVLIAEMNQF